MGPTTAIGRQIHLNHARRARRGQNHTLGGRSQPKRCNLSFQRQLILFRKPPNTRNGPRIGGLTNPAKAIKAIPKGDWILGNGDHAGQAGRNHRGSTTRQKDPDQQNAASSRHASIVRVWPKGPLPDTLDNLWTPLSDGSMPSWTAQWSVRRLQTS